MLHTEMSAFLCVMPYQSVVCKKHQLKRNIAKSVS